MSSPRMFLARIASVSNITNTTRRLILHVPDDGFVFHPGMWVDFAPESLPGELGGYSITSSPLSASWRQERFLELAVKVSSHKVAQWVHSPSCRIGEGVSLGAGGSVYFDPERHASSSGNAKPALFLAGGVGITPLMSMIRHVQLLRILNFKSLLLYSSTTEDELLYRTELDGLDATRCRYFVTREKIEKIEDADADSKRRGCTAHPSEIARRRITREDLAQAVEELGGGPADVIVHLCGPSNFLDDMQSHLLSLGCRQDQVLFEKWW
jgi:ferredoxin-NADP reductase